MTGKYRHNLDSKGRLFIPARLREELGERFYVTIGLRHSLLVLPVSVWQELEQRKRELPMAQAQSLRFFYANAAECVPDKQGRILLPAGLREYGGLTRETVIVGFGDRAELWDAAAYDAMERAFLEEGGMDAAFASLEI